MAPAKDKWVRRFVISETARHKKGFTIYKVTSVIFLKSSPEAVSKVSVWKRYNDFRKLHSELSAQHASLSIKEAFPPFPKPKFFGRFEADIIEERRKCAIRLLEFVAKYTSLFTSNVFVKFFESSYSDDYSTDGSQSVSSDTSEDDQIASLSDSASVDSSANVPDNIKNTGYCLPQFVCPKQIKSVVKSKNSYERSLEEKSNQKDNGTISLHVDQRIAENCNSFIEHRNFNGLRNDLATSIVNVEQKLCEYSSNDEVDADENSKRSPNFQKPNQNDESQHVLQSCTIHDGSDLPVMQEDSAHYILIAAAHMSAAFRHEVIAEYEEAFMQYKLGISNLLNGVQSDSDVNRRSTIKEKISKYLQRAERLYNRHLNCNTSCLNKPVSELRYYKVLQIMGSVMLVRDTLRECDRVIKTLEKPASSNDDISNYILRSKVLYMVQLYAYVQTETTVFLILQYISRGKLWDHVKSQHKLCDNKRYSYKKGHTRSISCDAMIQPNCKQKLETSHEQLYKNEQANTANKIMYKSKDVTYNLDDTKIDNNFYPDESLRKLEEEFGVNSKYNKDLPTQDLLEKAQKLLQSVNATLRKSNSVASRLNESEQLLHISNETILETKNNESAAKYSKMFINNNLIYCMHNEEICSEVTNKKDNLQLQKDASGCEQMSSKNSRSIDENENTEDNCDLSELSTSDSNTDLSTSKDKIPSESINTSSPDLLESRDFVTEKANERDIGLLTYNSTNETHKAESTYEANISCHRSQEMQSKDHWNSERAVENGQRNETVKEYYVKDTECLQGTIHINQLQSYITWDDSNVEIEQKMWKLSENSAKIWAAEILSALESLHQQNVMILDLKPDNILLDDNDHIAMTYIIPRHNGQLPRPCRPYTSPELCMFSPIIPASTAADVWSFGVLLYELLTGTQFQWRHPGLFHSHSIVSIPDELSQHASSLLSSILKYEPSERLTIPEIKRHSFFEDIDWSQLLNP